MTQIDLNQSQCIRAVEQLGYTEVYNICSGAVTQVPWGVGGWATAVFAVVTSLLFVAATVLFGSLLITMMREGL